MCISELLELRKTNNNLRDTAILSILKVKTTTYGLKSQQYTTAKLWNSILNDLRKPDDHNSIKNYLAKLDFTSVDF